MVPKMNMDSASRETHIIIVRQTAGVRVIIKVNTINGIKQIKNREIQ